MSETAPGSVAFEAIQYLRTATGEVTSTELANGIGRPTKRIKQHLAPAIKAGLITRRVEAGFAFWRLGPNADAAQPPQAPTPDESERQRVVKVSAAATPSIFAYADQRKAAPFSVALSTDGRVTLERHGRVIAELTNAERQILVNTAALWGADLSPILLAASKALDARIAAGEPCIATAGIATAKVPTWNDAQIKRFQFREQLFLRRNLSPAAAEKLADELAFRDFDRDDRRGM